MYFRALGSRHLWHSGRLQPDLRALESVLWAVVGNMGVVSRVWPDGSLFHIACDSACRLCMCPWKKNHFAQTSQMVLLTPVLLYLTFFSRAKAVEN